MECRAICMKMPPVPCFHFEPGGVAGSCGLKRGLPSPISALAAFDTSGAKLHNSSDALDLVVLRRLRHSDFADVAALDSTEAFMGRRRSGSWLQLWPRSEAFCLMNRPCGRHPGTNIQTSVRFALDASALSSSLVSRGIALRAYPRRRNSD